MDIKVSFYVRIKGSQDLNLKRREIIFMSVKYCNTKLLVNEVEIKFSKKKLTAYGGFSLFAGFFQIIRLKEFFESISLFACRSNNSISVYAKAVSYFTVVIAGGKRFAHLLYLNSADVFEELFAAERIPKSAVTFIRFFKKVQSLKLAQELSDKLWQFISSIIIWKDIPGDWITMDSTILERYGKQEGSKKGYNPKKTGRPCHNPLLAFLNKSKYVINVWNRPGNCSSGNNSIDFFDQSFARISDKTKVLGVVADSGFYIKGLIERFEVLNLKYIVAARIYGPLQRIVYSLSNWRKIDDGIEYDEFQYEQHPWGKLRRYIVIRQNKYIREKAMGKTLNLFPVETEKYRYSVWLTNSDASPYEVWKEARPRSNDENTIKELKESFALGGFSMKNFYAVEAAMNFRIFMYNLFVLFKQNVLGKEEKRETLNTLRYKYFAIPAQLGGDGNRSILRISTQSKPIKHKLYYFFSRIIEVFSNIKLNCGTVGEVMGSITA